MLRIARASGRIKVRIIRVERRTRTRTRTKTIVYPMLEMTWLMWNNEEEEEDWQMS